MHWPAWSTTSNRCAIRTASARTCSTRPAPAWNSCATGRCRTTTWPPCPNLKRSRLRRSPARRWCSRRRRPSRLPMPRPPRSACRPMRPCSMRASMRSATKSTTRSARSSWRSSRRKSPTSTSCWRRGSARPRTASCCARSAACSTPSRAAAAWSVPRRSASSAGTSRTCSTACSMARARPARRSWPSSARPARRCRSCLPPCAAKPPVRSTSPRWKPSPTAWPRAKTSCWTRSAPRRWPRSRSLLSTPHPPSWRTPSSPTSIPSCWKSWGPRSAATWKPWMHGWPKRVPATPASTTACCARSTPSTVRSQ